VTNCIFSGNSAPVGGGMHNGYWCWPTVTNCTFSGNSAINGGGMSNFDSYPKVTNCTFSGNSATNGGGLYNFSPTSRPVVTNSILWGDTGMEIINEWEATAVVTYCDIQGGYSGVGNIDANPLFVNPAAGDFHLQPGSPCIDVGNNAAPSLPSTDFEGEPRIVDGNSDTLAVVDMGVDEYVQNVLKAVIKISPDSLNLKSNSDTNALTSYIELPAGYEAGQINKASIKLEVNEVSIASQPTPTSLGDYDRDGVPDLMVKFGRQAVITALAGKTGNITMTVTGQLNSGLKFMGKDTIKVISPGK
jgi:hypothetical protein